MKLTKHLGWIYAILVLLIVAMGTWWVVFLIRDARNYERLEMQRLDMERMEAQYLIRTLPEKALEPASALLGKFPDLTLKSTPEGMEVRINPAAEERARKEARRRLRMFISEGIFFLVLLAAGTTIIILAYRREREFKSARELFLSGATHEFRTPLASLKLYTETLARPELEAKERDGITRRMVEDLDRLDSLVEQVLAMSREEYLQHGKPERLDLARETERVLAAMEGSLKLNQVQIETDLAEGCRFMGIRPAFALALSNLVQNAALYSPTPARIAITLTAGQAWHGLAVRDWGPGIPRRYQHKIFQSFFRMGKGSETGVDTSRGSGLGLFLVRRNMKILGGKVALQSEEGKGSTFTLVIPAHREEPS